MVNARIKKAMKETVKTIIKFIVYIICVLIIIFSLAIRLANAETMVWQTIQLSRVEQITVIYEYPSNMELGDEISFYCKFKECSEEDFNYTWQYSGDGKYWTNFGSKSRLDTIYCNMLAGCYVRLVVGRK